MISAFSASSNSKGLFDTEEKEQGKSDRIIIFFSRAKEITSSDLHTVLVTISLLSVLFTSGPFTSSLPWQRNFRGHVFRFCTRSSDVDVCAPVLHTNNLTVSMTTCTASPGISTLHDNNNRSYGDASIPSVLLCNTRSLAPRIDELASVCSVNSADIVCIIES